MEVFYTMLYLCISTDRIHNHRDAVLPFRTTPVGTSSEAASQLQLWKTAKAGHRREPWHPPAVVARLFSEAER